ncbi:MFS transporter [Bacillus alveayuensis]|uniref:MFS transporter n=1 Tax=Aeribacillus alveayuensis TaxID=279215 RepID=UPI000696EF54|nr:MFS transporter [Bacillus alveayuensis]
MKNKHFQLLWYGQTISLFGSQISIMAIPLTAVTILNATSFQMGILQALHSLPFFLFSLFVGVWIDRTKRKPFLLYANWISAALLLTIPLLYFFDILSIYHLYVVIFLTATAGMIFELAYLSYIPSVVPPHHLAAANSKLEASRSISSIAGPSLAGGLIAILTAPFAIIIDAVSFLISTILIHFIKSDEQMNPANNKNIFKAIKEGLAIILKEPIFKSITFSTAILNFCGSAFGAVYILYVVNFLGISSFSLGLILGLGSVGALLGSFITNKFIQSLGIGKTLIVSCIFILFGSIIVPLTPAQVNSYAKLILLCSGQLLSSIGSTIYFITQVSLRQTITPNHLLGRVNASNRFISRGFMPIGAFIGGALGSLLSIKLTLFIFGFSFFFSALILFLSPTAKLKQIPEQYEMLIVTK